MTREQALTLARKVTGDVRDCDPRNALLLAVLSIPASMRLIDEGFSDEEINGIWEEAVGDMVRPSRLVNSTPSAN